MKSIKLILAVLVVFCMTLTASFAQQDKKVAYSFSKGQIDANFGIGLKMATIVNGSKAYIPPVSASIDYGITNKISIGLNVGYTSVARFISSAKVRQAASSDNPDLLTPKKQQIIVMGVRIAAHYNKIEKLDVYGGPVIGVKYDLTTLAADANDIGNVFNSTETEKKFAFAGFVGVRYHLLNNLGIFVEAGALHAPFQIGVNFKL